MEKLGNKRRILWSMLAGIALWPVSSLEAFSLPQKVEDIYAGSYHGSEPKMMTEVNGSVYFIADSGNSHGDDKYALWISNGTPGGTRFVKDLDNPEGYFTYGEFTAFRNRLFFRGRSDDGYELWSSDGTWEGTLQFLDIFPGSDSSGNAESGYPEQLVTVDTDGDGEKDLLFFLARTEDFGKELWRSDGTSEGTFMIEDIHTGRSDMDEDFTGFRYHSYAVLGHILYFSAVSNAYDDGAGRTIGGFELWRSDGTKEGTYMVLDMTPYNNIPYGPGSSNVNHLTALDGILVFSAVSDNGKGDELYRSDGTARGTVMVKDINPRGDSHPSHFVAAGTRLFFIADDGLHGRELWVSDGTEEGTHMVRELVEGPEGVSTKPSAGGSNRDEPLLEQMTALEGNLFFRFNDGSEKHGFELWVSDGTANGTHLYKDIGTGEDRFGYAASGYPDELTVVGRKIYFSAWDPIHKRELWESNGTLEGTHIVADMATENDSYTQHSSFPTHLAEAGGTLFFSARNFGYRNYADDRAELWKIGEIDTIDFNRDGVDDILVHDKGRGTVYSWIMKSDGTRERFRYVATIDTKTWKVEGVGDFDGDGITDILVRNGDGRTYIWKMDEDGSRKRYQYITKIPAADWQIAGVGCDFNGDGIGDIVVRNRVHGWTYVWLMNEDGKRESFRYVTAIPERDWEIAGVGCDFNGDGIGDILVRNRVYGWTYVWLMNRDGSRKTYRYITALPEREWAIEGTQSDFDRNGIDDIVVRNRRNGATYVWIMENDGSRKNYSFITTLPFEAWEIAGTRCEFNGDGVTDLVVRKKDTGEVYTWLMNENGSRDRFRLVARIPADTWDLLETDRDFDRNGRSDFLVMNRSTSTLYSWLMNGEGERDAVRAVVTFPSAEWEIVRR